MRARHRRAADQLRAEGSGLRRGAPGRRRPSPAPRPGPPPCPQAELRRQRRQSSLRQPRAEVFSFRPASWLLDMLTAVFQQVRGFAAAALPKLKLSDEGSQLIKPALKATSRASGPHHDSRKHLQLRLVRTESASVPAASPARAAESLNWTRSTSTSSAEAAMSNRAPSSVPSDAGAALLLGGSCTSAGKTAACERTQHGMIFTLACDSAPLLFRRPRHGPVPHQGAA